MKTIAVIRYKTALYDFYILYSFTSLRQFLINLSFWLFMKTDCYSCGIKDSFAVLRTVIIALKASGRDCTNNNELLHKIGVLQRYAMQLFVFTSEL